MTKNLYTAKYILNNGCGKKRRENPEVQPWKNKKSDYKTAKDAHVPVAKRKELIKEVALPIIKLYKNKRVKSTDLRKIILRRLSTRSKATVSEWKRWEKRKKKK